MSERAVSRSTLIPADPADVWDALTTPASLEEWLADEVEADDDLEPGIEVVFRWDDGRERRAVVDHAAAPERLGLHWVGPDGDETSVVFELAEEDGGTRVTVTERGLAPAPARAWGPRLELLGLAACAVPA